MPTPAQLTDASSSSSSSNKPATLPTRPKLSSAPATVDDYIEWLTELAQSKGMIGMSTEMLSPEKFSALFSVGESSGMPLTDDATELNMALGEAIKNIAREEYLMKVLKENVALVPKVKDEINKRLLAVGANMEYVQKSYKTVPPLMRAAELANLRNPPPAPKPKFVLWLEIYHYDALSSRDTVKVYLDKDSSFDDFLEQMKSASTSTAQVALGIEGGLDGQQGFWVYQVLNKRMQVRQGTPKVVLEDGRAYVKMLKELSKELTPSAVLRHERMVEWEEKKQAELKAFEEELHELDDDEPLDEDGKPYFDHNPDWDAVRRKFFKDGFPQ
ncbi:MAG: hypothetical protein M1835_005764 [Candelina submexicana]|nr:MAG: hypothetical protein M1835_005764 [Candelina submexicana]